MDSLALEVGNRHTTLTGDEKTHHYFFYAATEDGALVSKFARSVVRALLVKCVVSVRIKKKNEQQSLTL